MAGRMTRPCFPNRHTNFERPSGSRRTTPKKEETNAHASPPQVQNDRDPPGDRVRRLAKANWLWADKGATVSLVFSCFFHSAMVPQRRRVACLRCLPPLPIMPCHEKKNPCGMCSGQASGSCGLVSWPVWKTETQEWHKCELRLRLESVWNHGVAIWCGEGNGPPLDSSLFQVGYIHPADWRHAHAGRMRFHRLSRYWGDVRRTGVGCRESRHDMCVHWQAVLVTKVL